ncbi:MAG: penicillin-binding protein 1C [Deltaproteobacteria bacterium]|nr:penicillin-binding protein 1C [Deltaproteobacteria bacterium]
MRLRLRPKGLWGRRLGVLLLASLASTALLALAAALAPLPRRLDRAVSPVVLDKDGGWMRVQLASEDGGVVRIPVEASELPPALIEAVLDFEDRRFYLHPGIDPLAVLRAGWLNLSQGRVVSGGSTITMQVARLLERRPRTLGAKLLEAFRAIQLELHFSKEEILTWYFNLAPYGGNLEGIGSAAYYYYDKPVEKLTLDECATLAALPNSPTLLAPGRNPARLLARRNDVLTRMAESGKISESDAQAMIALPLLARRRSTPSVAPHLTRRLLAEHPEARRIQSSIDRELQLRIERLLADHLDRLDSRGISNGAVVLIENATRQVRAYVGSKDFFDAVTQGQVDGASALRSPGSTLKPFVYALALDRGLIGANTLLEDVPIYFKDWAPMDFDERWRGVVPAHRALAESLNVPAVRLAARLEPDGLVTLLARAGFQAFRGDPRRRYGLATVLGGSDVTLLELTNLYATLAQGGLHRPWSLLAEEAAAPAAAPKPLFSPGSAYLVAEILTDVRRPELPEVWRDAVSIPRMAWKTGTSYGRRDAWSVGFNARWSLGVWIGNFDARGAPELIGAEAAAPLFFALAQILPGAASDPWIDRPASVVHREVCALSGATPGPSCPHRREELALEGAAPRAACPLHVAIDVDDDTGERLCVHCRQGRSHHSEVHVEWPAEVAGYLADSGLPSTPLPPHHSRCSHSLGGDGPAIRTPLDGDEYAVRPGVPLEHQQIALIASVEGGGTLYWFVDDALVSAGLPGRPVMLAPSPGSHRVVAMDAEGRKSTVTIRVR